MNLNPIFTVFPVFSPNSNTKGMKLLGPLQVHRYIHKFVIAHKFKKCNKKDWLEPLYGKNFLHFQNPQNVPQSYPKIHFDVSECVFCVHVFYRYWEYIHVAIWLSGVAGVQADFRVCPHILTLTEWLKTLTVHWTNQNLTWQQLQGERHRHRCTQIRELTLCIMLFTGSSYYLNLSGLL